MPNAIHREITIDAGPARSTNFQLEPDAGEQTRLVFDHTGFPAEAHEELAAGWGKMYWEPLQRYLG